MHACILTRYIGVPSKPTATSYIYKRKLVMLHVLTHGVTVIQLRESLAPNGADHNGAWRACKLNRTACNESQLTFLRST